MLFKNRNMNKHVALQNLSVYYTWKDIRKQYKNNTLRILSQTWNDEFKLSDGFILFLIFKIISGPSLKNMKH